jgi:hypothetical protein
MTKDEAIEHYESALKEAFPRGATGDVFHYWNEARKALAEQPAQQGCMRCNTPKKCALYGCSPLTWPAEQPEPTNCRHCGGEDNVICAGQCKVQPAQQEPDVFDDDIEVIGLNEIRSRWRLEKGTKLYTSPPAQQEPVAWERPIVYTPPHMVAPAQRTWVGLTDEEITDIWAEASPYYHEDDFARAIEAKLKEKNT